MSGIIGGAGSKSGVLGTTELDYEEGTWPPASSVGVTKNNASYTKWGNRVVVDCYISFTGTSSGDLIITGLPYTNSGTTWSGQSSGSVYMRHTDANITTAGGYITCIIATGAQFYVRIGGTVYSGNDVADFVDSGTSMWMSLVYETTS